MRYFLLLPLWLLFEVLGAILWPILPLFFVDRLGPIDNNNRYAVEPRLPKWLSWFDTPDNSLWGDDGWRAIHCPDWESYWGMAKWLRRNRSVGFSRSVLARYVYRQGIKYEGDPYISVDRGQYGVFKAKCRFGAWQYKRAFPMFNKSIGLNFGWNIDPMVKDLSEVELCHYKLSIKIKDRK